MNEKCNSYKVLLSKYTGDFQISMKSFPKALPYITNMLISPTYVFFFNIFFGV